VFGGDDDEDGFFFFFGFRNLKKLSGELAKEGTKFVSSKNRLVWISLDMDTVQ
jgi:hypothetical protein